MSLPTIVDSFWLQVGVQGIIAAIAISIAWGSAKAKAQSIHEKLDHTEQRLDRIEVEVKASSDRFVSRQEFIAALLDIKDQLKETRADVKRVLELVSKRAK
jgi:hypothetical protein